MLRVAVIIMTALGTCAPRPQHVCPAQQPPIDSSCEAFALGLGCLYAGASVGCSCEATLPAEREGDHPWTQVWRCGEHGEEE